MKIDEFLGIGMMAPASGPLMVHGGAFYVFFRDISHWSAAAAPRQGRRHLS